MERAWRLSTVGRVGSCALLVSRSVVMACVAVVTTLTSCTGAAGALESAASPTPARLVTITIPAPANEIPSKWLSYPGPPRANVLLPAGYNPNEQYPLLIMLNGLNSDYAWFAQSGLTAAFAGLDAIVVMPEGGSGWYADWWNGGQRGGPSWESYALNQVIPAILSQYPILPQRQFHALAGVSMGGLGAVYLGGRLPGFFGSVASLSGFVDPGYAAPIVTPGMGFTALAPFKGDFNFNAVDGPPDGFYANGHDPVLLAGNLKQTRVFESTGSGIPSSAGLATRGAVPEVVEGSILESLIIYPMNQRFHSALTAAGVDLTYQVHPGGHDNPDFAAEIRAMIAWGPFGPVAADPTSWTNQTVATSGQLWDVNYQFTHPPNQVVRFQQSGMRLSIGAAGSDVTITTSGGCTIRTQTPATVMLPFTTCG